MAPFLEARFDLNEARARALWSELDLESVRTHLARRLQRLLAATVNLA